MSRLTREHRLPLAIAIGAVLCATSEINLSPEEGNAETLRLMHSTHVLLSVYPDDPRMLYRQGIEHLSFRETRQAAVFLAAAFDGQFREDEKAFSSYLDMVMLTQPDRILIQDILERWRVAYPVSRSRRRMEERLARAGMLR